MITWSIGTCIFLIGLYSVFHLMGLTTIALTVLGGTGLLGIILGIPFKDITENLLASIFLSINNPFHKGDLIEIEGITGYVQSLTIRSTILISLEGELNSEAKDIQEQGSQSQIPEPGKNLLNQKKKA